MKLCFFADASNIHTIRWTQYFAQNNHEVHIITPAFRGIEKTEGINIYKIPYFYSLSTVLISFPYMKLLLKRIKPDLLHGIFLSNCGFYASLMGYRPFIGTALGSDVLVAPEQLKRRREQVKYTLKKADIITVDADILRTKLIDMSYPASKIKTIYFGVDSSILNYKSDCKNKGIISIRSLNPIYNIDVIIKAFLSIKHKIPHYKLTVVGDISKFPHLHYDDSSVKYIDPLPHNDIIEYMTDFNIFISVPSSDASSVSLLEAMAIGLFPIVSDLPANREWIKHGYNGLIVPSRDINTLADSIIEAIENEPLREKAVEINRLIVQKKALFLQNMKKLEKIYRQLI